MSQADQDLIRVGVEQHLAGCRVADPGAASVACRRRSRRRGLLSSESWPGPAVRGRPRGNRRLGLLVAVGASVGAIRPAYGLIGGGSRPSIAPADLTPGPSATASVSPPSTVRGRRASTRRSSRELTVPVRPRVPLDRQCEDGVPYLDLVYFLDKRWVGRDTTSVLSIFEPRGVYDPVDRDQTAAASRGSDRIGSATIPIWSAGEPDRS